MSSHFGDLTVLLCPSQLPSGLYKKVLVILHDSILPHMNEPTLMIDFLTVAYGVGEQKQAFSLCVSLQHSTYVVRRAAGCNTTALGGMKLRDWDEFSCLQK